MLAYDRPCRAPPAGSARPPGRCERLRGSNLPRVDNPSLAGVGNVYRAEALFICRIHPERPAREVTRAEWDRLWSTIVAMLRAGERAGRMVTVDPREVGATSAATIPSGERTYVYRRNGESCRRCGHEVRRWDMASRRVYACGRCQA